MTIPSLLPQFLVPRLQPGNAGPRSSASKSATFYGAWQTGAALLEAELPGSVFPGWSLGTRVHERPVA